MAETWRPKISQFIQQWELAWHDRSSGRLLKPISIVSSILSSSRLFRSVSSSGWPSLLVYSGRLFRSSLFLSISSGWPSLPVSCLCWPSLPVYSGCLFQSCLFRLSLSFLSFGRLFQSSSQYRIWSIVRAWLIVESSSRLLLKYRIRSIVLRIRSRRTVLLGACDTTPRVLYMDCIVYGSNSEYRLVLRWVRRPIQHPPLRLTKQIHTTGWKRLPFCCSICYWYFFPCTGCIKAIKYVPIKYIVLYLLMYSILLLAMYW